MDDSVMIRDYAPEDETEIMELLIKLHGDYKQRTCSKELFELTRDRDIEASFRSYLEEIQHDKADRWKISIAKDEDGRLIGFIIGSIEIDPYIELNRIGVVEDWFVEPEYRGRGIGRRLYAALEEWFRERGCHQVRSDTWIGNSLGRQAHESLGFLRYGINYRKRL